MVVSRSQPREQGTGDVARIVLRIDAAHSVKITGCVDAVIGAFSFAAIIARQADICCPLDTVRYIGHVSMR